MRITQPKPTRGLSWHNGRGQPAIPLASCPPTAEMREKMSSHLRIREDNRFHSTPATNAIDSVARVRVTLLPSNAETSRGPQSGAAGASACSSAVRGRRLAKSAVGEKFLHNSISGPINCYLKFSRHAFGRHPYRVVSSDLPKDNPR